jgi:hypothetical protein
VDGSSGCETEVVVDEVSHGRTLKQVVMSGPVVAGAVVLVRVSLQVRGQRRRGVGARDHRKTSVADQRGRSSGSTGARGTDDTGNLLVRHDLLGGSHSTFSGTKVVETRTRGDSKAVDVAVVRHCQLDADLVRNAEESHLAGDRVERPDLDFFTRSDRDGAERAVPEGTRVGVRVGIGVRIGVRVRIGVGVRVGIGVGVRIGVVSVVRDGLLVITTGSGDEREGQQHGKQHHELA